MAENGKKLPSKEEIEEMIAQVNVVLQFMDKQNQKELLQIKANAEKILRVFNAIHFCNHILDARGLHFIGDEPIDVVFEVEDKIRKGLIDEAEDTFVSYYRTDFEVRYIRLVRLPNYELRKDIIEKAHAHFLQGDYISCVPLVLMMADGAANDVLPKGIFAEGTDMEIWNCVGTEYGIVDYLKSFTQSRKMTRGDEITIPYRNGILHGRDTGYGTEKVALKAWALLFNICDLIINKKNSVQEKKKYDEQQKKKQEDRKRFLKGPAGELLRLERNLQPSSTHAPIKKPEEWLDEMSCKDIDAYKEHSAGWTFHTFMDHWKHERYAIMFDNIELNSASYKSMKNFFMKSIKKLKLNNYNICAVCEYKFSLVFIVNIDMDGICEKKKISIPLRSRDDRNESTSCINAHHWVIDGCFVDIVSMIH